MNQSYVANQSSEKKLITRSVANSNQQISQNSSRDKLNPNNSLVTSSVNTSQQSRQKSFLKDQKSKIDTRNESRSINNFKQQQTQDKNMFYSELHIETHDIDVPLVKILKVNQQLLKKFIQQSSLVQNLMVKGKTRSISLGFRAMTSHLIQSQRYNLKIMKVKQIVNKMIKSKLQLGLSKLFATRNKFRIKQKGLIVLNRLIICKINSLYRHLFKNVGQKKLMGIVMNKVEQDELVKMKINLEIFRQITFSKDFIVKCRPLIKYNGNNKGMFEKQLVKANFQQCIRLQLQRYQKIRHNVNNRNPNSETQQGKSQSQQGKKGVVKRKPTINGGSYNNQSQYYENQVVLLAIKSFNLSLNGTKQAYEQKITQLNQHISQLQNQQRYNELQQLVNLIQSNNKAYESAIIELYSRADEQIKKVITQFPLSKDQELSKKKLLPVISAQINKYQKTLQKHQKLYVSNQKPIDDYLAKLHKSRCFTLDFFHQIVNTQNHNNEQFIYKQVYNSMATYLQDLIQIYSNPNNLKQFIDKINKNKHQIDKNKHQIDAIQQSSVILVNLSECFLLVHQKYQTQKQKTINSMGKKQEQSKTSLSRQNQSSKKSLQKDKSKLQDNPKIQRKTSQTNNFSASKQESIRNQLIRTQTKLIIQKQTSQKPLPSIISQQVTGYNVLIDVIRASIIEHLKSNNKNYQNGDKLQIENNLIKKSLLPQLKGKTKLEQNVEINSFVQQINSQVQLIIKNLNQGLIKVKKSQNQLEQVTQMISVFYQLILSSSNKNRLNQLNQGNANQSNQRNVNKLNQRNVNQPNQGNENKFSQINKKWTEMCKKNTQSEEKMGIINTLNQILMIHKQMITKQSKPQQNFSEQLKKILKQKLQFEKLYNQMDKKLLIKQEEYNIIEKQNKDYLKKHTQTEKQLNKLKHTYGNYQQNLQNHQQSITRLKQQLNVYVTTAKNQAQQNNKLNRQLAKMKNQVSSLNQQLQRIKLKQSQLVKVKPNKNAVSNKQQSQIQKSYKLKIAQLQESVTQTQNQKYQLNENIIQLKTQLINLQRTNDQSKFQIHKLNQQLQRNKISITKLPQLESTYLNHIQKLQYERDELKKTANQLRISIQIEKKEKILLDKGQYNRLRQLQVTIDGSNSKVQRLQTEIHKLNQQIRYFKQQLNGKNMKILQLQTQVQLNLAKYDNERQNKNDNEQQNKYVNERQNYIDKLKQLYQQQISQLQYRITSQEQSYQSTIRDIHSRYQQLYNSIRIIDNKTQTINQNFDIDTHNTNGHTRTTQNQEINPKPDIVVSSDSHSIVNRHNNQLTVVMNRHSRVFTVLQYDPQKEIKSLKEFIETLQKQNQKLQTKYNAIKKELYSDDTLTQLTNKSTISSDNKLQQKNFYQSLVNQLKVQNDRLYAELLKLKSSPSSLELLNNNNSNKNNIDTGNEQSVNEFWMIEIKRKQQQISQLQSTITDLNIKLQKTKQTNDQLMRNQLISDNSHKIIKETQLIHELQQQITKKTMNFTSTQQDLKQQIMQLSTKVNHLQRECLNYRAQIKQLEQSQEEESLKINLNYSQLLVSTKQVKQLFTSFIQATNTILQKLDRTSQIYLNFESSLHQRKSSILNHNRKNENGQRKIRKEAQNEDNQSLQEALKLQQQRQGHRAEQSIISLVQQFKTVIQNNHQTLKSIYQNLVCHPYTKTALQLQYLKQLTFTVVSKFHSIPPYIINPSFISPQPLSYTYQLACQELAAQIDLIFTNSQQRIKPIQEIFVQVEQLILSKIQTSLDAYKNQLHLKAIDLDHTRHKLNLLLDYSLIDQQALIHQIPHPTQSPQTYHQRYHQKYHQKYQQKYHQRQHQRYQQKNTYPNMPNIDPLTQFNPIQSQLQQKNYQYQQENMQIDSISQEQTKLDAIQAVSQQRRPFSGNWVSKTTSNFQYRPLTSLIDKYDLAEQKITENHREVMYRSYMNPYESKNHKEQQFSSSRFS